MGIAAWLGCRPLSEAVREELEGSREPEQLQQLPGGFSLTQVRAVRRAGVVM